MVRVVPEFGGDEDFGAGDAAFLDGFAYCGLGAVAVGVINEMCRQRVNDGKRTFELCRCGGIRLSKPQRQLLLVHLHLARSQSLQLGFRRLCLGEASCGVWPLFVFEVRFERTIE